MNNEHIGALSDERNDRLNTCILPIWIDALICSGTAEAAPRLESLVWDEMTRHRAGRVAVAYVQAARGQRQRRMSQVDFHTWSLLKGVAISTLLGVGANGVAEMTAEKDTGRSPERLLRLSEVCHRVGLGKTMIYALKGEGRFPRPCKITPAAARWSEREVADDVRSPRRALGTDAICYVVAAKPVDRTGAGLGVPLVAWVAFATVLSEEIWRRKDFASAQDRVDQ